MAQTLGIYIHIPFCNSKCYYCDFFSRKQTEQEFDKYTQHLCKSIEYWGRQAVNHLVNTVYFGGGTPSLLGTNRLVHILNNIKANFNLADNCEVTLEANPTSSNLIDFKFLHQNGFNRLSIGVQTSDDNELKSVGRTHNLNDAVITVDNAKKGGFDNISLDLMLGLPSQTIDSLCKSIDFVISQDVQHISCYMLKVEEGTVLHKNINKFKLCSEDEYADFYNLTCKKLRENNFEHYEISNFCKKGFESKHNNKYWQLDEYIGIGASAHSFFDGKRFFYPRSFEDFYNNKLVQDGDGGNYEEYVMLSLRTKNGLNLKKFKEKYGFGLPNTVLNKANIFVKNNLMDISKDALSLTEKGFLLSNEIIVQLLNEF